MRSLSSVRVFWPDEPSLEASIREYSSRLLAREEVVGVYLCGSRAKETHTVTSDVDLLVLIRGGTEPALLRPHDRIPAYLPDSFPVGLDLFVYTEEEARSSPFVRRLMEEAVPLLEEEGAPGV
ncbi:MAG TPA: nucleotidyltransferase domain-containing protein [Clostridiales bacterium]|nr:nucleotidyltransferase domain-containing protein [Clostridiales bacterium]